jgi:hypothetical protein
MASRPDRIAEILDQMQDRGAKHRRTSLIRYNKTSTRATLMKDALEDWGHDGDELGDVDQWYFEDQGVIAFDLTGGNDGPR